MMTRGTFTGFTDLAKVSRERWLAIQAEVIGPDLTQRRQWKGIEEIASVLTRVADGRFGGYLATARHVVAPPGDRQKVSSEGVDVWGGPVTVELDTDSDGTPVLMIQAEKGRTWLEPYTLTYLPCPMNPLNAVFSLTVAGSTEPGPGTRYTAEDLLRDPASNSEPRRWVTGGVMFVCSAIEPPLQFKEAPETTWNNFPALERWVARTIDTPPPRTTTEGLADPVTLAHIRNAFATNRERTGRMNKPLDQSDIDSIGRACYEVGLQMTVQLVREVVGSGSPSTIHPLLKSFWARARSEGLLGGAAPTSTTLPVELTALYEGVLAAARATADEDLRPARELLKSRESTLSEAEKEVAELKAAVEQQGRELRGALEQLERQVVDLKGQRDEARQALERAQHIAVGDASLISELRAELAGVRDAAHRLSEETIALNAAIAQREGVIAERDTEVGSLKAAYDGAKRDADQANVKLNESERRFDLLSEQFEARLADERAAHAQTLSRLTSELADARERAAALEHDRNARAERVIQLEAAVAEDARTRATLTADLAAAQERIQGLTVELRLTERVRDARPADGEASDHD